MSIVWRAIGCKKFKKEVLKTEGLLNLAKLDPGNPEYLEFLKILRK
jgi:hypothetical protein